MPRDPSGNYTLPALGNPAVTNTPITIAWWNGTSTDMATAFTDSLSRSGLGGMLVPFTLVDGTVSAPAFAFQNEPNTGFYRAGSGDMRVSVLGSDVFKWNSTAVTSLLSVSVTGTAGSAGITVTGGTGDTHGINTTGVGNGNGVQAQGGISTSAGVAGVAGTSSGYGVYGSGAGGGLGVYALSSSAAVDVLRADGYVDISHATAPSSSTSFQNRITPKNLIKAWARFTVNGSDVVTIVDGFNVTSITYADVGRQVNITLAGAMADANYFAIGFGGSTTPAIGNPAFTAPFTTTTCQLIASSTIRSGSMEILVIGA